MRCFLSGLANVRSFPSPGDLCGRAEYRSSSRASRRAGLSRCDSRTNVVLTDPSVDIAVRMDSFADSGAWTGRGRTVSQCPQIGGHQ